MEQAYRLIEQGWGLKLGHQEEQRLELAGELLLTPVKVKFFYPVATFILEGDKRHPTQEITKIIKDQSTRELISVDYTVTLPRRSFDEFLLWVHRYMDSVKVISPPQLVERHQEAAQKLFERYKLKRI